MTNQDIIAAWKNERVVSTDRSDLEIPTSPIGPMQVDPAILKDIRGGTTLPCFTVATATLSCFPPCPSTIWDGSCNVASYGCCPAE